MSQFFQLDRLVVEGGRSVSIFYGALKLADQFRESKQGAEEILLDKRILGKQQTWGQCPVYPALTSQMDMRTESHVYLWDGHSIPCQHLISIRFPCISQQAYASISSYLTLASHFFRRFWYPVVPSTLKTWRRNSCSRTEPLQFCLFSEPSVSPRVVQSANRINWYFPRHGFVR